MDAVHSCRCKSDRIAEVLRERLRQGALPSGKPLASTRLLATEFHVAPRTADRAVRKLVDEGLLVRVPGAGTWRRGFKQRYRIACLIDRDFTRITAEMYSDRPLWVQLLLDELERRQCDFECFSYYDLRRGNFSHRILTKFDGVIAEAAYSDPHSRQLVCDCKRPKVWLANNGRHLLDPGNQVIPDFLPGLLELLTRARRAGISRVRMHVMEGNPALYLQCAAELTGWTREEYSLEYCPRFHNQLAAYKMGLKLEAAPDILHLCDADMAACGIMEAFLDRGLQPGEFNVSGIGNIEALGFLPFGVPRLTTIAVDRAEAMRQTVSLLLNQLHNHDDTTQIIRISGHLVIRESALKEKSRA